TCWTFAVGWISICGIPPFSGFWSKDAIIDGAFENHAIRGNGVIGALGIVVAAMTEFYMTRMFATVFVGSERIELGGAGHGGLAALVAFGAGALGHGTAWPSVGPEKFARGGSAARERALGFWEDVYNGFLWLVVLRGGTAMAIQLEWCDQHVINSIVNL